MSDKSHMRMREKVVLRVISRLMMPFILLFALYVQFHGDFGPGGGFQAGVIFAAGLILYGLIFGMEPLQDVVPTRAVELLMAFGVLLFGGVGVVTMALGGRFLDYDLLGSHGQHYGIFTIELGVGFTVASTMVKLFYCFGALERDPSP